MSWSQGNIQWTFPFKSLNGTNCRIDVYKKGYTGDFVYSLTCAANPVSFSDDDSEDLLNDVLRYRTGYIRVIEQYSYGYLNDIYPHDVFDRYVEIMYGQTLIFNGFIQLQDFSSELVPIPRELELPIISPLGLMENRNFSNIFYLPPTTITILELINIVSASFGYQYFYVPKNYGYPNTVSLLKTISTLVISPWNENFHYSDPRPMYNVMTSRTYSFIVDAICKAFGWICHDTPEGLVFTAFDHDGDYLRYTTDHIDESAYTTTIDMPSTPLPLTDYFELADNNAQEKNILPETGIEINYDGISGDRDFSFAHFYCPDDPVVVMSDYDPQYPNHAEIFSVCSLLPVPLVDETDLIGTFTFDENNKLSVGTHAVAWNGHEGVMVSVGSYPSDHNLFYVRFYMKRRSNQSFGISYELLKRSDGALGGLNYAPDNDAEHYITTVLDLNNSHPDYVQVNFRYHWGGDYPQLNSKALLFIYNIRLEVCEDEEPFAAYRYKPADKSDILPNTQNPPVISSSITMPISLYRLNDNLIGETVFSTKLTEYPYMFAQRKVLVSKFKIVNELALPYAYLISYLNKKWRIIAMSWNLWNDEVTINAQHSSTL